MNEERNQKALAETNQALVEVLEYVTELEKYYDLEIEIIAAKQAELHEAKLRAYNQAQLDYRIQLNKVKKKVNALTIAAFIGFLITGVFLCLK